MATITIDNTSSEQLAKEFLYRLDLDVNSNSVDPNESTAIFIKNPLESAYILRSFHERLNTPDHTEEILSYTDTKASVKTSMLTTDVTDVDFTMNLTGLNLKDESKPVITGISLPYKYIQYFDNNKTTSNIDVNINGTSNVKIRYNPNAINTSGGNADGNMVWQSDTTSDKGYFHDDDLVKFNSSNNISMSGNLIITTKDEITGVINTLKTSSTETNTIENSSSSINLVSKLGIYVNEKQEYAGTIDTLSFTKNQQNPSGWSGGVNYKETIANQLLASVLGEFISNQADTFDLTAALLSNNDKITAKGAWTTINGYLGNDAITLGSGNDTVEFSTALGPNNIDSVKGFKSGSDHIRLSTDIFSGYSGSNNFLIMGTRSMDADDRIIYDSKTGKLYYDADGSGAATAIQFATLVGKPSITADDIWTS